MWLALSLTIALFVDKPVGDKTLFDAERFRTLVDPDCSYCHVEAKRAGEALKPDDRVLAWLRGPHDGGAIPYRWFLVPYRVISDSYGVFVYDPDAGFVRGWPASYDFRFHGWRNGVMVMRHTDGTLFDTLTGLAFDGPRKGERLTPIASLETDWSAWLDANPKTVAYEMKPSFRPSPIPSNVLDASKQSRLAADPRLDPEARVFGLAIGDASAAWPLATFGPDAEARPIVVGGREGTILWSSSTRTAVAFGRRTEGKEPRVVTLEARPGNAAAPFVDRETGSRWNIAGRAVSGPLQGESLDWLPGVMVKWYAWASSYPKTELIDPRPR